MKKVLFYISMAIACVVLAVAMVCVTGCDGSGGMGGQGLVINVYQNATPDANIPGSGTNSSVITTTIDDGGTLENPSVEVPQTATVPTTQPQTPVTPPAP